MIFRLIIDEVGDFEVNDGGVNDGGDNVEMKIYCITRHSSIPKIFPSFGRNVGFTHRNDNVSK